MPIVTGHNYSDVLGISGNTGTKLHHVDNIRPVQNFIVLMLNTSWDPMTLVNSVLSLVIINLLSINEALSRPEFC